MARLEGDDSGSPQMLNLRLDYADFLLGETGPGCEQRLARAQTQLDSVAATPGLDVLLPLGPARIADDEYQIHLARTACGTPEKGELTQALTAAEQAVGLYRDAFDYRSAAIMQFNVAATYRKLGDADNALAGLKAAIAMDRDCGLQQDAEDNDRLLLEWTKGRSGDGDIAALMKDFPARTAEFKFNWPDTDADVAINASDTSVIHGKIIHSDAAIDLKRAIQVNSKISGSVAPGAGGVETADVTANLGGTTETNTPGNANFSLGNWPDGAEDLEWPTLYILASDLLQAPGIQLDRNGDFRAVTNPEMFTNGLADNVYDQIMDRVPSKYYPVRTNLTRILTPDFVEAAAEQDYGLQTGTWIGAKLEQGVWYQMTTPLFLPGLALGHYLVQHTISFAFTRELPCPGSPDKLCAEIILHAIPDTNDLKNALGEAGVSSSQLGHVSVRTDMRLVVDPQTLLPYVSDTRQSWYDKVGKRDPIVESIRTVSTSTYH